MSNKSKVRLRAPLRWHYIGLRSLTFLFRSRSRVGAGLLVDALLHHLQGVRGRAARPQAALALPGAGLCSGLQGHAADIQVRGAAVVLGHPRAELQGELHEHVWRAQGQDDDAGDRWQVRRARAVLR